MNRKRLWHIAGALVLVAVAWLGFGRWIEAQVISRGTFLVAVRGLNTQQSTVRVVTSVDPNRTEIGCESFVLGGTTVNCLRLAGSTTTNPVTIAAIPAQAGDTNIGMRLTGAGTGAVTISPPALGFQGTTFQAALTGTCSVSAPTALTAFAQANGQVPCTATGLVATDRPIVQAPGALESNIALRAATSAAGSITLNFVCVSSTVCPTTAAQTYVWWAIRP